MAEGCSKSQVAHCKRFVPVKSRYCFQTRIELACSNKDIACLFQAFGRVHNCTFLNRKVPKSPKKKPTFMFRLGQTFQAAQCENRAHQSTRDFEES